MLIFVHSKLQKLYATTFELSSIYGRTLLLTNYLSDDEAWSVLLRFQGDRPISKLVIGWVPAYSGWVP